MQLFIPDGRGVRLSTHGQRLAQGAAALLENHRRLAESIRSPASSDSDTLSLGGFEVFTTYFLAHLKDVLSEHPLKLYELTPGALETAIAERRLDLGVTYLPVPHADVEATRMGRVEMGIFGRSSLLKAKSFTDLPFVVPIHPLQGTPTRVTGLDGWPEDKAPRKIKYRVALMESALELCRHGLAVAYLPRFVARLHNETVKPAYALAEFAKPAMLAKSSAEVFLLSHKSAIETKLRRRVARSIREALG